MKFSAVTLSFLAVQASAFAPINAPYSRVSKTPINAQATSVILEKTSVLVGASSAIADRVAGRKSVKIGEVPDAVKEKIDAVFPGSVSNRELVSCVFDKLSARGYGRTSLVATSLCCDEVTRVLEKDFGVVYNDNFHMGGLAGFPFGGVTSFGAMASHIPDGGSCLVVFGPHVGVDSDGNVGTTERRGRMQGGACCGSAVAASGYVAGVLEGDAKMIPSADPTQAQQIFVSNMLLPHAERLRDADDKMVELPYALYDAQKDMITEIIKAGSGAVAGNGNIALLGGIQINTPPGSTDYFLPLSFEFYNNKGDKLDDLTL
eukprot:CAMPEP_0198138458 /NCGR_PEP_ID=MMETSP1443-20131203/1874_1 /TAXON_ID=186043 /ORGANISM="Entomoneis sp., Strain CCMP2396" /LENGTH=317 /DNA_ID=CAMNT_0043800249 /DNA_START=36 /DNA_END=989 /DNA_ORIENTATION=-